MINNNFTKEHKYEKDSKYNRNYFACRPVRFL